MLTDTECRSAKPRATAYKLTDSHGLHLEVKINGVRAWRYRYRIAGRENLYAMGNYPDISLKDARKLRDEARLLVKKGIHPSRQRRLEMLARASDIEDTLEGFALNWYEHNTQWSAGYRAQVQSRMDQDVFPWLGKLPLRDIKPAHILDVLRRVEKRSPVQAKLVQTWVSGLCRHAVVSLRMDSDPSAALRRAIKSTKTTHYPSLKAADIGEFLRAVNDADGSDAAKAAVHLMWLTAVRVNEVVGARWDEFDLDAGLWIIPAGRMKANREHIIPLSDQAIQILHVMKPWSGTLDHVFPQVSDRSKAMSKKTLQNIFYRAGYAGKFSPHGIRGTFSTIANEARFHSDVIELCLAHGEPNKVRASYNAALLIDDRRKLLQWWADLSDSAMAGGAVIPFRQGAA